jgi:hypothetical protein
MTWYIPVDDIGFVVWLGVLFGLLLGIGLSAYWVSVIRLVARRDFKRYYQELNDRDREYIRQGLNTIEHNLDVMSRRTNTRFVRRMYNDFIRFKSYLKEKWIGN